MSYPVQMPVVPQHEAQREFQDENATHYGLLMGGAEKIEWTGIGESAIGHHQIPRRTLTPFVSIPVGRRNDIPEALDSDSPGLHKDWYINPARVVRKTAKACAGDVLENFKQRGFVVPAALIGLNIGDAIALTARVMPAEVAAQSLKEVIAYLSLNEQEGSAEQLRLELLEGAYVAQNYLFEYIREVKAELGREKGKKALDQLDIIYFGELKEVLPEEKPAQATLALGKEIATAFSASKADDSDTKTLLAAIVEQNRLQAESNRLQAEQNAALITQLTANKPTETPAPSSRATKSTKG